MKQNYINHIALVIDGSYSMGRHVSEVKVSPTSHPDYSIFVQSKSVNRNLMPETKLLLLS